MQTIAQDRMEEEIKSEVAQLLEQLFAQVGGPESEWAAAASRGFSVSLAEGGQQQVLLDVEWRGERYVLVRAPQPAEPVEFELEADEDQVHLSPREQEIVRLVAKGYPNKTIAGVLDISQWTVSTHLRRIFAKLGVNSRAEMVATALSMKLTTNHDL